MKRTFAFCIVLGLCLGTALLAQQSSRAREGAAGAVTFNKDVAPIIFSNCTACHQPGETAPMAFMSYKQVRPWAKSIRSCR